MSTNTLLDSPVWKQFQDEARKRRSNPVELVTKYMSQCLEVWEDEALDEEVNQEARSKSDYTEEDAVELVRHYRQEKRK